MNRTNFNNSKALWQKADAIDALQALTAVSTNHIRIQIVDTNKTPPAVVADEVKLKAALGPAYDTLIASVKTSLNTSLGSEETSNNTALGAL